MGQKQAKLPNNFDELASLVEQLNNKMRRVTPSNQPRMSFELLPKHLSDLESPKLWKTRTKIRVSQGEDASASVVFLSVTQFSVVVEKFFDFIRGTFGETDDVVTPGPKMDDENLDRECPVCLDAPAAIVLPCTHAFCQSCMLDWSGKSDTCPLCRATTTRGEIEDSWLLTDGYLFDSLEQAVRPRRV